MVVTPPSVGLWHDEKHRYYWNGEGPLTSITTAQKALDKPALVGWAKRETAACAVRNLDMLAEMVKSGGPESAVAWLKNIPDYQRNTAANLGTRIHLLAEKLGQKESPEVLPTEEPYVEQYRIFLNQYQPEVLRSEAMVCSLEHRYAGTGDLWARFPKLGVGLIDIKTGSGVYPDTALQLAGLKYAEFMGWPDDPKRYPIPESDFCAVLHLQPDTFELVPYDVTADTFEQFLRCLRLYEWLQGPARRVMQQPIPVPQEETLWAA